MSIKFEHLQKGKFAKDIDKVLKEIKENKQKTLDKSQKK